MGEYGITYKDYVLLAKNLNKQYKAVVSVCSKHGEIVESQCEFLNSADMEYLKRIKNPNHRKDVILGRLATKKAISLLTNEDLNHIVINKGVFNQPIVVNNSGMNLQVTTAHTSNHGIALAFDEGLIMGIDLEKKVKRNKSEKIFLSQYENDIINIFNVEKTIIWTIREALIKCLKLNLFFSPKLMELDKVCIKNGVVQGSFKYFSQYVFKAFDFKSYVISIVFPANVKMQLVMTDFDLNKQAANFNGSALLI